MTFAPLLDGIARQLATIPGVVYDPDGYETIPGTPIVFGDLPETPDRVIALRVYADDIHLLGVREYRVQVAIRGLPDDTLDADSLGEQAKTILHGTTYAVFGNVRVSAIRHLFYAHLGVDGNRRTTITRNFQIISTQ